MIAIFFILAVPGSAAPNYANGFPADPGFFPIGVWLQNTANAPAFKALGINTYVGLSQDPTEVQLAMLAKSNMFAVAVQDDATIVKFRNASVMKGWIQQDEPDNAQPDGRGGYGPCIAASKVAERSHEFKLKDPSRPILVNFGQGVAYSTWIGRGTCTGDMGYYDAAVKNADIVSFDIYPIANNQEAIQGKLEYVGLGVENLMKRIGPGQMVWADIETTKIGTSHLVTPEQLRSEVWMALIHGARGIDYFVHEWTGGFREDGIFRYPEIAAEVTRINATIKALAPVLNSPIAKVRLSVGSAAMLSFGTPAISTMVKIRGSTLYIFAISMQSSPTGVVFSLPDVKAKAASVAGESRSVAIANSRFTDSFGPYGVHRYEIRLAN
jgi:hypothetical protein